MRIKIVHIIDDMEIGGQEREVQLILTSLNKDKYQPFLLCLKRGGLIADELSKNGINTEILGIENYKSPVNIWKVAGWLKRNGIKIIHTHAHPAAYLGRMAAILVGGIGIVHHVHTVPLNLQRRHHLKERLLGYFSDRILCCSQAVKNFIIENEGIPDEKIDVVYNGVKDPLSKNIPFKTNGLANKLNIDSNSRVVGCVASLMPHKGHKYLLEAFKSVLKYLPNAKLLLVGDGQLKTLLQEQAVNLGISQSVIFCGYQKDVFPFISLMDVVVLPSIEREGMPVSLIESMAMGKPVIASNLHGVMEVVVDNYSGILVPPKDSSLLSQGIIKLLENEELGKKMGVAGRERFLSLFTRDIMMKRIEGIYDTICKEVRSE